jgi:pyruvate dehydrogenase E1 component beta subunit
MFNPMGRELKFYQAINEAIDLCMAKDPNVYIMGLGVPDPGGIFGTTKGLEDKYGSKRVMDLPTSENGNTGVAIGSALAGMRPILTHHRVDFAMLSMEQLINQAAKWYYVFGQKSVPMVVRAIIGRGWGQGPQHSQSLQALFTHTPGLKVIMPATPYDAKGLLISAIEDDNPVICIEHRWLYNTFGNVPEGLYRVPLGQARVIREGTDITIVAISHMVVEAIRGANALARMGIEAEIIDVRTLRPLDKDTILQSVRKTGHLIVADTAWKTGGFAGEIVAVVTEEAFDSLKSAPKRITLPDTPTPASPALSQYYYPHAEDFVRVASQMLGFPEEKLILPERDPSIPLDVPDMTFTGPF